MAEWGVKQKEKWGERENKWRLRQKKLTLGERRQNVMIAFLRDKGRWRGSLCLPKSKLGSCPQKLDSLAKHKDWKGGKAAFALPKSTFTTCKTCGDFLARTICQSTCKDSRKSLIPAKKQYST